MSLQIYAKLAFFKHMPQMHLQEGMHSLAMAKLARIRGAVLHFKFLRDFTERVHLEAVREEHWREAAQYKRYPIVMNANPGLSTFTRESKEFSCGRDLIEYALVTSIPELEEFRTGGARANHHRGPIPVVPRA